ncbi:MAG: DUF4080 domain-containing protein [Firmicutes bacterium]|nr:DUF4080 domain-containing protein [Bacillota bacterium]
MIQKQQSEATPVALATLNAKFIHSNLALDYLRAYCEGQQLPVSFQILEFHINQPVDYIVGEILSLGVRIIGFSCYIWNISETLHVISRLKLAKPDMTIIIGGPEVSYDAEALLQQHPEIDYCITGEGERSLAGLLARLLSSDGSQDIRQTEVLERIIPGEPVDLAELPSPYPANMVERYRNKLVYLETSRGCPFACRYCLSANTRGVKYFPWERVKGELLKLLDGGFPQIKLIDRTFNANQAWARRIFEFLVEENARRGAFDAGKPPTVFHFEINADVLTEELITYLRSVPPGLFQFEIGIQSTTPAVLEAVGRKSEWQELAKTIRRLAEKGNIHLHLDLIAGLPEETYESFRESFDDVYRLGGHRIQLGFLKLLKGSGLRLKSEELGLVFDSYAPYEIISTPTMSALDLVRLKEIESLLEQYHNSHRFGLTLWLLCEEVYTSSFQFFEDLAAYFRELGLHQVSHSQLTLYDILYRYIRQCHPDVLPMARETLKFDFLRTEHHRPLRTWMPDKLGKEYKHVKKKLLQDPKIIEQLHPATVSLSPRDFAQQVRIGRFSADFVKLLIHRDSPRSFPDGVSQEQKNVVTDYGWLIFDHHRSDPWTAESAYSLIIPEDR